MIHYNSSTDYLKEKYFDDLSWVGWVEERNPTFF